MSDLLTCPFCGTDDLSPVRVADELSRTICNQCNAAGPIEGLFEEGETWNTRAAPSNTVEQTSFVHVMKSKWREEFYMWRDYCDTGSRAQGCRAARRDAFGEVLAHLGVDVTAYQLELEEQDRQKEALLGEENE